MKTHYQTLRTYADDHNVTLKEAARRLTQNAPVAARKPARLVKRDCPHGDCYASPPSSLSDADYLADVLNQLRQIQASEIAQPLSREIQEAGGVWR